MIRMYNICGLNVSADFRHDIMIRRSEKYVCDAEKADIVISYNPTAMEMYRKLAPHLTEDERELMATAGDFYMGLLKFDGFMLHSSAVAVDNKAYLFSAPSGTGKSTHTQLWCTLFGEKAVIINDDKPAIRQVDGKILAYGTPWSGKSDLNVNVGIPLQGICVLSRSENNFIEPLDEGEAIFSILNQTIRPEDERYMDLLLGLLDKTLGCVKVWKMGCNISTEAAKMAYETMSKQ